MHEEERRVKYTLQAIESKNQTKNEKRDWKVYQLRRSSYRQLARVLGGQRATKHERWRTTQTKIYTESSNAPRSNIQAEFTNCLKTPKPVFKMDYTWKMCVLVVNGKRREKNKTNEESLLQQTKCCSNLAELV